MDEASKVLSASRVTIVVRGVRFEMRRWSVARAAEVFGAGTLQVLEGGDETDGATVEQKMAILKRRLDVCRKIFEACAISPRPGDVVGGEGGIQVTLDAEDFDDFMPEIVARLLADQEAEAELFGAGPAAAAGPS